MGSFLSRKRAAGEELATLSVKAKQFRRDIECMASRRRNTLWYISLLLFFATTTTVAYCFMKYEQRLHQWSLSSTAMLIGSLALFIFRKITNTFFDFLVRRKQTDVDELIAKKKFILENVKETETFKVAKELIEKYENDEDSPSTKPSEPTVEKVIPQAVPVKMETPPQRIVHSNRGISPMIPSAFTPLETSTPQQRPSLPNFSHSAVHQGNFHPTSYPNRPQTLKPIRPFAQIPESNLDKVVDYFFGDGPNQKFALICCQCHTHNGMAFPGEYEYLAYVCYRCGHFNPARKMRVPGLATASAMTTPALSRHGSTRSLGPPNQQKETKEDDKSGISPSADDLTDTDVEEEPKEKALLVSDSAAEEEEENIKANISEGKTLLH